MDLEKLTKEQLQSVLPEFYRETPLSEFSDEMRARTELVAEMVYGEEATAATGDPL